MDHTQQKLFEVTHAMTVGAGDIHERLADARRSLAVLVARRDGAFPAHPEPQDRFDQVIRRLRPPETLSRHDASELAADILSLLVEASRLARTPVGAAATVPLEGAARAAQNGADDCTRTTFRL